MRKLTATVAMIAIIAASMPLSVVQAQDSDQGLRDAIAANTAERASADDSDAAIPDDGELFLTDDELDELVAPVALYPDALLAQVLVAATYPLQIVEADRLLKKSEDLTDAELGDRLTQADWDPSVMVLASGFPTVVTRMSDELEWTEKLGNAMVQQDEDVLTAVQRKRAEAQETGYLADNAAQVVEEDDSGKIAIKPADPEVVYVPTYDPEVVYTSRPTAQPYIAPVQQVNSNPIANPLVAGALAFGGALLVQNLFGDDDNHNNKHKNDGWNGYWHRDQPIDWRDQQFYPRPRWDTGNGSNQSWGSERDRYWNPSARRWQRDTPYARREYNQARRDTLGWLVVDNPNGGAPVVRAFRPNQKWTKADEQARRQAVRAAERRSVARAEADRRFAKQRAAEVRHENQLAAARRDARLKSEAAARQQRAAATANSAAATKAASDAKAQARAAERRRQTAEAAAAQKAAADRRATQQAKAVANSKAKAQQAPARPKPATVQSKPANTTNAQAKAAADARASATAGFDPEGKGRPGCRKAESAGTSQRQGESAGPGQRQGESSGTGESSGSGQRQGESPGSGQRQGESSGTGESSGSGQRQGEGSGTGQRKGQGSGPGSGRRQGEGASAGQCKSQGAGSGQRRRKGCTAGKICAAGPEAESRREPAAAEKADQELREGRRKMQAAAVTKRSLSQWRGLPRNGASRAGRSAPLRGATPYRKWSGRSGVIARSARAPNPSPITAQRIA